MLFNRPRLLRQTLRARSYYGLNLTVLDAAAHEWSKPLRLLTRNSSSCAPPFGPLRILFAHLLSGAVAAGVSGVEGVCKSCWVPALRPAETQARQRCTFQCSRG